MMLGLQSLFQHVIFSTFSLWYFTQFWELPKNTWVFAPKSFTRSNQNVVLLLQKVKVPSFQILLTLKYWFCVHYNKNISDWFKYHLHFPSRIKSIFCSLKEEFSRTLSQGPLRTCSVSFILHLAETQASPFWKLKLFHILKLSYTLQEQIFDCTDCTEFESLEQNDLVFKLYV